jgi:hypothetical protein
MTRLRLFRPTADEWFPNGEKGWWNCREIPSSLSGHRVTPAEYLVELKIARDDARTAASSSSAPQNQSLSAPPPPPPPLLPPLGGGFTVLTVSVAGLLETAPITLETTTV